MSDIESEGKEEGLVGVREFEEQVFRLDDIRIVIRAKDEVKVRRYPYTRKASGDTLLLKFLGARISPVVGDNEFVVVSGDGSVNHHPKCRLSVIQSSYVKG